MFCCYLCNAALQRCSGLGRPCVVSLGPCQITLLFKFIEAAIATLAASIKATLAAAAAIQRSGYSSSPCDLIGPARTTQTTLSAVPATATRSCPHAKGREANLHHTLDEKALNHLQSHATNTHINKEVTTTTRVMQNLAALRRRGIFCARSHHGAKRTPSQLLTCTRL